MGCDQASASPFSCCTNVPWPLMNPSLPPIACPLSTAPNGPQTAMVPDAGVLARLAQHLVSVRPPASPPVAFPGRPLPSDLDVLASEPGTLPGQLTTEDVGALRELRADLREICARAQERGVRVIVDAEHRCAYASRSACTR